MSGRLCAWQISAGSFHIDHVTLLYATRRLHGDTAYRHPPLLARFRGYGSRLENPHRPKPFVYSLLVPEYLENVTAPEQYELLEMTRISGFVDRRKGLGRPTKRDSRELSRFKEESYTADDFYLDWEDE